MSYLIYLLLIHLIGGRHHTNGWDEFTQLIIAGPVKGWVAQTWNSNSSRWETLLHCSK